MLRFILREIMIIGAACSITWLGSLLFKHPVAVSELATIGGVLLVWNLIVRRPKPSGSGQ